MHHCGASRQTLRWQDCGGEAGTLQPLVDWTRTADFPEKTDKGWPSDDVLAYAERVRGSKASRVARGLEEPQSAEIADYHAAKAKKMVHSAELEQQKGNLIPAGDVERAWSEKNSALNEIVERRIAKTAPQFAKLNAAEALKLLRGLWRDCREESAQERNHE